MCNKLIFLSVLALIFIGTAICELSEVTKIPASQDVYFNMDDETAYSNADILRCEETVTNINGTKMINYSGVSMIQFDISGLNMTDNDIGILVLKAASIKKQSNESALVAMMPVGSDWNEESDFAEFVMNFLPISRMLKKNDISQMGVSTDGDRIFAFDVSNRLQDAKAKGNLISFLLMAISNSTYRVDFMSRESGEGPYLIVMPYPAGIKVNRTLASLPLSMNMTNQTINNTIMQLPENISLPGNASLQDNQALIAPLKEVTMNQTFNRTRPMRVIE